MQAMELSNLGDGDSMLWTYSKCMECPTTMFSPENYCRWCSGSFNTFDVTLAIQYYNIPVHTGVYYPAVSPWNVLLALLKAVPTERQGTKQALARV